VLTAKLGLRGAGGWCAPALTWIPGKPSPLPGPPLQYLPGACRAGGLAPARRGSTARLLARPAEVGRLAGGHPGTRPARCCTPRTSWRQASRGRPPLGHEIVQARGPSRPSGVAPRRRSKLPGSFTALFAEALFAAGGHHAAVGLKVDRRLPFYGLGLRNRRPGRGRGTATSGPRPGRLACGPSTPVPAGAAAWTDPGACSGHLNLDRGWTPGCRLQFPRSAFRRPRRAAAHRADRFADGTTSLLATRGPSGTPHHAAALLSVPPAGGPNPGITSSRHVYM